MAIRKAFRMSVDPANQSEYVRRHQPIWRELEDVLLGHGVVSYSIFLDRTTSDLFGYVEIEDETRWAAVAGTDACRRWWQFMQSIMASHPDGRPITTDLAEVFHIEAGGSDTQ